MSADKLTPQEILAVVEMTTPHPKLAGQSELPATPGSAIAPETDEHWRKRTRHHWKKHNQAMDNFMKWRCAYRGKKMRRLKKWMREVERTLYAIPDPPETETA